MILKFALFYSYYDFRFKQVYFVFFNIISASLSKF